MIHININAKLSISKKKTIGIVLYVPRECISSFLVKTLSAIRKKKGVVYIAALG